MKFVAYLKKFETKPGKEAENPEKSKPPTGIVSLVVEYPKNELALVMNAIAAAGGEVTVNLEDYQQSFDNVEVLHTKTGELQGVVTEFGDAMQEMVDDPASGIERVLVGGSGQPLIPITRPRAEGHLPL